VSESWAAVLSRTPAPAPAWCGSARYRGTPDQVSQARGFLARMLGGCPAAGDAILLASEICANAVQYSDSRKPGGEFTVYAKACPGSWLWTGIEDEGGTWVKRPRDPGRMHGLDIVAALAGDDAWGIVTETGGRLVWFRLGWTGGTVARRMLATAS